MRGVSQLNRTVVTTAILVCIFPLSDIQAADPIHWRTDYHAARKEALESGLPIFLQIGTDDCVYCRKMEATTFRDPGITSLLGGQFIAIKMDGNREMNITKALKIQVYPTTVLAGYDGTIYNVVQGYVMADALRDHLKRTIVASGDDLKLARELADATTAMKAGDYAKALATAQRIALVAKGKPAEGRAAEMLEDIEKVASERLVAASASPANSSTARAVVAGIIRTFPGTRAAVRAEAILASSGTSFETSVAGLPKPLVGIARELIEKGEYADAYSLLIYLSRGAEDNEDTKAAKTLLDSIKTDPVRLQYAAKQSSEKAAAFQLALSEVHLAQGNTAEATACLEQVLKLCPTGQKAEIATIKLTKLKTGVPATPATLQRERK